ncbi:hypothetical protein RNAN_1275 [Rheinheimera nanhaiensis E407-8]|uniref:Uncharacterized protein n=1 Tax=Rheinheimera nanhaiensis E407-8 TaxID=562729 RepID=I1DW75_9GAMM|nr:hypothetical protein RNAN_1275 [Rheinheimera nanhaiensis E407-8]
MIALRSSSQLCQTMVSLWQIIWLNRDYAANTTDNLAGN